MARLTWQNVSAPDFTPAMRGIQNATTLLSNAFNSASDAVGQFQGMQADTADRAILSRLANVQDPSQFDANTIIGSDGSRASTTMLKSVADRPGTLLDWATRRGAEQRAQQNQDFTNWGNTRTQESAARMDAAGPDAQRYWSLLQQGKTAEANSLLGSSAALKALNGAEYNQIVGTGDSYTNRENTAYSRDRSRKEDAFNDSAAADAETLRNMGVGLSPENDEFLINALNWDPRRTQRALGYAGSNRGSTGGASTGDPTRAMNYEARASGFSSVPDSVQNLGQASDFALQVNAANQARTGSPGSSAMGTYQIVGDTMRRVAPQVFGTNWRNVEFNQANQDKIAEAIFNANNQSADALRKQWVSLSPAQAEQVRKMPWSQAREIIAKGESGANSGFFNPAQMVEQGLNRVTNPAISSLENASTRDRINRSQIGTLVPQYETSMANTNDPVEAAQLLQKQFGGSVDTLTARIRSVMADGVVGGQSRINAATAAAIVQSSLTGKTEDRFDLFGFRDWAGNSSTGSDELAIDNTVRDELVRQAKTDGFRSLIQTNENEVNAQNMVNAATQRTAQIDAALRQAITAKNNGRSGMDPLIQRLTQQRNVAAAQTSVAARNLALLQAPTEAEKAEAAKRPEPKPLTPEVRAQLERSRDEIDRRFPVY